MKTNMMILLFVVGCCGSLSPNYSQLKIPPIRKYLDAQHQLIAEKKEGILYAGATIVEITTEYGKRGELYLGGFEGGRKNRGVRDPIYANILYLDDGVTPFVVVSADVIGFLKDDVDEIRKLASDKWQDNIIIASTHNHVGPDTIGFWGKQVAGVLPVCSGRVPNYMEMLKYLIAQGIDDAAYFAKPSRIRVGEGDIDPTLSENIHPSLRGIKETKVKVLVVEDLKGNAIGVLANWGCHAEAMWNDIMLSADWPGVFYRYWKERVGGVPIFVQGGLGGLVTVNPGKEKIQKGKDFMEVFLKYMNIEERLALRDRVGKGFFDGVYSVYKSAQVVDPNNISIKLERKIFTLSSQNWIFNYMGKHEYIKRTIEIKPTEDQIMTEVVGARIRDREKVIATFITVPGEPSPQLTNELEKMSQEGINFVIALGNDELGYIVRESDWDIPDYEYERTMSLGKETGTIIINVVKEIFARI